MTKCNGKTYIAVRFDVQSLETPEMPIDMATSLISIEEIKTLDPISLIRDENTAHVVSDELGFEIKAETRNTALRRGDTVVIPIFVAGLNPDDTVSFPYVAIDHFIRIDIMPF